MTTVEVPVWARPVTYKVRDLVGTVRCERDGCARPFPIGASMIVAFAGEHEQRSAVFHPSCWEYLLSHPFDSPSGS